LKWSLAFTLYIGRLRNDLCCVEWDVNSSILYYYYTLYIGSTRTASYSPVGPSVLCVHI